MRRATESDPVSMEELRRLTDQEAELLSEGAAQRDPWGINLYPDMPDADWLEFESMVNLRPSFGNRSRGVDDPATRTAITELVHRLVIR